MYRQMFLILGSLLILILLSEIKGSNDYAVGRRNDTKPKEKSYTTSANAVSRGIAEVGKTFHYGMIGEINKVTTKNGEQKVGFLMKRMPFIRHIPKLAGTFGALGTMLSIVMSFIPRGDSPELIYMKKSFSNLNRKLDGITNSLEESKKLVKEYSQKAVYLKAEHNIIQAYEKLESLVPSLLNLACKDEQDCKRKKMKTINNHISLLDVRSDVEMILKGASKDSIFGISLLKLISESSGCDINRIKTFQSAIAALTTKGSTAASFHDSLKKHEYDMAVDIRRFQNLMLDLERKRDEIMVECYDNINRYILSDVIDQSIKSIGSSVHETNEKMVQYLSLKYPWMTFYVVTVKTNVKPIAWAKDSYQAEINAKSNSNKGSIKHFILFGSNNRVENKMEKADSFRSILSKHELYYEQLFQFKYDQSGTRLLNAIDGDKYLHNQLKAFVIVPENEDIVVGYIGQNLKVEQVNPNQYNLIGRSDLMVSQQCVNTLVCSSNGKPIYVIATIFSEDQDISQCSKPCNGHGKCYFLPHTKSMGCKCSAGYYGDDCSMTIAEDKMALDLGNLMDIAFKIPSLLDISYQLEDVHVALQADMSNIQNSIHAMDKKLTTIFGTMSKELMTSFDWHGLITQYGKIVRDLKYFYLILVETKDTIVDESLLDLTGNGQRSLINKEKEEMARVIMKPNELRRHLYYLNYLFLGRNDISLVSHRSILFQTMDKHRKLLCSSEYKHILDKVYKQLLLLQFQGYILWIHALKLLNRDTSFVVGRYKQAIRQQREFFDRNTCQIKISNSINFGDCSNGYYLYSGMKEEVKCAENYHLTNKPTSRLFVNKVISVSSELSKSASSAREIMGPPDVYPNYGINAKAWSPSVDEIDEQQVIEVSFKDNIIIDNIQIYETFHGGAVWKIEGLYKDREWRTLMKKAKERLEDVQTARINKVKVEMEWSTSKLRVSVDCTKSGKAVQIDAIGIEGKPSEGTCSWYDTFSCTPCGCDITGSSSTKCSADGKCSCKAGYTGKKCDSRDCVMSPWQGWAQCQCGPRRFTTRSRSVQQSQYGEGKACETTQQTKECHIPCICGEGDWGDYCERKNCLVKHWGAWSNCPHQPTYICRNGPPPRKYIHRYRQVRRRNENGGHGCPHLQESKACPLPQCFIPYAPYG